jgi:hypothetical protein
MPPPLYLAADILLRFHFKARKPMFDAAHLHLMINHFPIIGTIIGGLLMVYALVRRDNSLQRVILVMWLILAAMTPIVMKTGEEAEEKVENIAGISGKVIHEHEEAAELSLWLMIGLGIASLATLFIGKMKKNSSYLTMLTSVLALIVIGSMIRTGYLGGQIRHSTTAVGNISAGTPGEAEEENNH